MKAKRFMVTVNPRPFSMFVWACDAEHAVDVAKSELHRHHDHEYDRHSYIVHMPPPSIYDNIDSSML